MSVKNTATYLVTASKLHVCVLVSPLVDAPILIREETSGVYVSLSCTKLSAYRFAVKNLGRLVKNQEVL